MAPRSAEQRKADVLARLDGDIDVWVATADRDARPHLVPLSLCWDGQRVVVAAEATSRTVRNAVGTGRARLALGSTRDVVIMDATVESVPVGEAPQLAERFAARADWDPRSASTDYVFLLFTPSRVQAWRDVHEIDGRTLMRRGKWLV